MHSKNSLLNPRVLCVCAMLIAMEVVLNRFCSINTMGLKIGFSFVPPVAAAMLYGPIISGIVYGMGDFIGALLFPIGPYHPGFTICAVLMGVIYGLFLHRSAENTNKVFFYSKIRFFPNMIAPTLINNLVLGLGVNTCWVAMLYGKKTYWGWFLYRLPEYAVLVPVILVLLPILLKITDILRKSRLIAGNRTNKG